MGAQTLAETKAAQAIIDEAASKEDLYWALAHPISIIGTDAFPYLSNETGKFVQDWDAPYDSVGSHPRDG